MLKKNKILRQGGARRVTSVGVLTAVAVAGVVAGAVLTKLLLSARANRKIDQQVERFRAQGAL